MTLKDKILEFVEVAKQCPEKLQELCFRVLLEDYLNSRTSGKTESRVESAISTAQEGTLKRT